MENGPQQRLNAFHYIIVGVLGFFAGSFGGMMLCVVTQSREVINASAPAWMLGGGIVVAVALPILLRIFSLQK